MSMLIKHNIGVLSRSGKTEYPGTFVAVKVDDEVHIGVSCCRTDLGDVYTKTKGVEEAHKRATHKEGIGGFNVYHEELEEFTNRAIRYFSDVPFERVFW